MDFPRVSCSWRRNPCASRALRGRAPRRCRFSDRSRDEDGGAAPLHRDRLVSHVGDALCCLRLRRVPRADASGGHRLLDGGISVHHQPRARRNRHHGRIYGGGVFLVRGAAGDRGGCNGDLPCELLPLTPGADTALLAANARRRTPRSSPLAVTRALGTMTAARRGRGGAASLVLLAMAWLARAANAQSAQSLPAGRPILEVPPRLRLLVVAPHPDDETLGAAGLMQRVEEQHGRVSVVYLTNGD